MLVGSLDGNRGTAALYLDGKRTANIDGYNDDGPRRKRRAVGKVRPRARQHAVRVVVDGKPYAGSRVTGSALKISLCFASRMRGTACRALTLNLYFIFLRNNCICNIANWAGRAGRFRRSALAPGPSARCGARWMTTSRWPRCTAPSILGVNFIDTADVYGMGRSERLVARLRKERTRDDLCRHQGRAAAVPAHRRGLQPAEPDELHRGQPEESRDRLPRPGATALPAARRSITGRKCSGRWTIWCRRARSATTA